MGPGCPLPTGSFCLLCKHPVCRSLCSFSSEPLSVPFCLPAGSKTREGVVQGVASGTSPTLSQALSLPQPESWLGSRGGGAERGGRRGHPQGLWGAAWGRLALGYCKE